MPAPQAHALVSPAGLGPAPSHAAEPGFEVRDLAVAYRTDGGWMQVVGGATIRARPGRITGVAGESGSGKTTAALVAIGYCPPGATRLAGEARLDGLSILELDRAMLRRLWATRISYVAQDAAVALNPARRIGAQLEEVLSVNLRLPRSEVRRRAIELLTSVRLPHPERTLRRFPHELSGGQLQRVAIAMAIAPDPSLIIFDEPTTGLDVTTQAEVIGTVNDLVRERRLSALYISHDLALLAAISDELVIFYAGEVVESGSTAQLLTAPRHPYTRALLDALPSARRPLRPRGLPGLPPGRFITQGCSFIERCRYAQERCATVHPELQRVQNGQLVRCLRADETDLVRSIAAETIVRTESRSQDRLLEVEHLVCVYGYGRDQVIAVDDVTFEVRAGEVVGLVGESGSGKSTIGRALVGLVRPRSGAMRWLGSPLDLSGRRTRAQHRDIQIVFQNPDSSLNPRHTVAQLVGRSVALFRDDLPRRDWPRLIAEALMEVQLDPSLGNRYPHELSGGQKQRVAIARAFVARPRLIICDEIISGQDVSVQAAILELVRSMQQEHGTALLFISHDLAAVRSIAEYIYVLKDGRLQEQGLTERLFEAPRSPYTRQLLAAVLEPAAGGGLEVGAKLSHRAVARQSEPPD